MNRLEGEGSVYKLKSGRQAGQWRAELVIGWHDDKNGNRQKTTKTRTRPTKKLAQAALRDLANERDEGGVRNAPGVSGEWLFGDWCAKWLRDHIRDSGIESSTASGYETVLRTWIVPQAGTKRLSLVTAGTVKGVLAAMGDRQSSKRQCFIVMHAALREAVRERLINRNPAQDVKRPTVTRAKIEPPLDEDVEAIYKAILDTPNEARWLVALILGLRQGEALGLEWRHVDLARQAITIQQQLVRERGHHGCGDPVALGEHKGNTWPCGRKWASRCPEGTPGRLILKNVKTDKGNRTIPLLPLLVPILERLREQQQMDLMAASGKYRLWHTKTGAKERDADLVFRTSLGRATEPRDDWKAWQEVLEAAGLEPGRLHDARHSAAVAMMDSGNSIERVADLLGHSSASFTRDTYGHLSQRAADDTRDALEAHHAALRDAARKPVAEPVPIRSS